MAAVLEWGEKEKRSRGNEEVKWLPLYFCYIQGLKIKCTSIIRASAYQPFSSTLPQHCSVPLRGSFRKFGDLRII